MKPVGGTRMRLTKVDACGAPITGIGSCSIVSKGFVSVARTAQFADPDEFVVKNAGGEICLNERSAPSFQWYNFEITFCEVDPEIVNLLTGSPLVMNDATPTPAAVGWRTREGANVNANVALELWTRMGGQACAGGTSSYGYYLAPFIVEGYLGDLTFENGPANFTVTGARSKGGGGWGTGPYNVINSGVSPAPGKLLTAMTAADHDHFQLTTLAPPAVPGTCGCVTLPTP